MIQTKLIRYYYIGNRTVMPTPPVGSVTDLMIWLDASRIVSADNTAITQVLGLSGNGNDFTSAIGPIYRATKVAGMPAMEFAVNQSLTGSKGVYNAQQNIFIAYSQRTGANGTLFSSTTGPKQLQREFGIWPNENNPNIPITQSLNTSNILRLSFDYTTDIYQVHQNQVLSATLTTALIDQNTLGFARLGGRGPATEFLNGNIHEIFVYNRILTAPEALIIEDYLTKKWGFLSPNSEFTVDTVGWSPYANGGVVTQPTVTAVAGEAQVDLMGTYANSGLQSTLAVQFEAAGTYRLYFDARSVNPTVMNIYISHNSNPSSGNVFNITATKSTYFFEFTTPSNGGGTIFMRTPEPTTVNPTLWFDNIYLRKVNTTPVLTNLVGWYNASNVTQSGGIVSQMRDISGSANHLVQATVGTQPLLVANSINGRPTVNFDGIDDTLESAGLVLSTNVHTVFLVQAHNYSGTANRYLFNSGNNVTGFGYQTRSGQTRAFVLNGVSTNLDGTMTNNAFTIVSSTLDATNNYNYYINNKLELSGVQTSNAPAGKLSLASRNTELSGYAEIKVAELLVYNRVLTTAEIATVNQYLNQKYNI